MAASMKACKNNSSSSSDSSEDENLEKLRDVAVSYQQLSSPKISNISIKKDTKRKKHEPIKPSLRPSEKTREEENQFKTTPEFREHVAKKLSAAIESSIVILPDSSRASSETESTVIINNKDSEFKLFTTSIPGCQVTEIVQKRPRRQSSSSDSSDEERFEACAVSGDAILAQSRHLIPATETSPLPIADGGNTVDKNIVKKVKKRKKKKEKVSSEDDDKNVEETVSGDKSISQDSKVTNKLKKKKKKT